MQQLESFFSSEQEDTPLAVEHPVEPAFSFRSIGSRRSERKDDLLAPLTKNGEELKD